MKGKESISKEGSFTKSKRKPDTQIGNYKPLGSHSITMNT
jgi:hypothetical protein